jgi:hypothetical protein
MLVHTRNSLEEGGSPKVLVTCNQHRPSQQRLSNAPGPGRHYSLVTLQQLILSAALNVQVYSGKRNPPPIAAAPTKHACGHLPQWPQQP